jgi:hypothetical protein
MKHPFQLQQPCRFHPGVSPLSGAPAFKKSRRGVCFILGVTGRFQESSEGRPCKLPLLAWGDNSPWLLLVLNRHRFRIDGFLACNSFERCQNPAIFVLIALHGKPTLLIPIRPSETNEVLL